VRDRYPAPNVFSNGREAIANNYRQVGNEDTFRTRPTRLDRYFGAKHRVFFRYSLLRGSSQPTTPRYPMAAATSLPVS
jgi:hypothetical protein